MRPVRRARSSRGARSKSRAPTGSAACRVCTPTAVPCPRCGRRRGHPPRRGPLGAGGTPRLPVGSPRAGHGARLPALGAIVTEDDEARNAREAAERHRVGGGPPGDDRHGSREHGEPGQRVDRSRVGPGIGRVRNDWRQGPVEVGSDQRRGRGGEDRVQAGLALRRAGAGQWHGSGLPCASARLRERSAARPGPAARAVA